MEASNAISTHSAAHSDVSRRQDDNRDLEIQQQQQLQSAASAPLANTSWTHDPRAASTTTPLHQSSSNNNSLRDRVLVTSANHRVIHHWGTTSQDVDSIILDAASQHRRLSAVLEEDEDFRQAQILLLLLITLLAWFSAMDAKNHCISHQAYAVYDMWEDGEAVEEQEQVLEQKSCKAVFRWVMIPVCTITVVMSTLLLVQHNKQREQQQKPLLQVEYERYRFCGKFVAYTLVIALVWSYGIVSVMLWPRYFFVHPSLDDNPYQSLAAVDFLGHIGDNANLYYFSWLGTSLSITLVYQGMVQLLSQRRRYKLLQTQQQQQSVADSTTKDENVEAVLSSFSTSQQYQSYRETRATWYNSIYKLRRRTGIWMAALLATLVVVASSVHVFNQVLVPTAKTIVLQEQDDVSFHGLREICSLLQTQGPQMGVPAQMCSRTSFSFCSASVAACLQLGAIVLHLLARQDAAAVADVEQHGGSTRALPLVRQEFRRDKHIPLKWEFVLSILLCNLLGLNAVLATGVQGPAAKVGNLYYASWISFLLCLRICLGCLEELYHIKDEEELLRKGRKKKQRRRENIKNDSSSNNDTSNPIKSQKETLQVSTTKMEPSDVVVVHKQRQHGEKDPPSTIAVVPRRESFFSRDVLETKRANRLRSYFFLGIFSTVSVCAGLDAAYNTVSDLTTAQRYMIVLPSIVAVVSTIQFLLCLHSVTYVMVSSFQIGGILSLLVFGICLVDLVLTMHSDSSWAVNSIGDIEMANMYYFTWASIITAGIQMVSYTKDKLIALFFGQEKKDLMVVVWMAVNKVCFVIIGAGLHVWHTISDTCGIEELQTGAVTFCSRTVFSILVGITGIVVASLVVMFRLAQLLVTRKHWCNGRFGCSRRVRTHVEAVVSMFLVVLFGIAVAIITGIGGPGQSVGDMYYATWLAFGVAVGVGVNCYDQIKLDELESAVAAANNGSHASPSSTASSVVCETPFVSME